MVRPLDLAVFGVLCMLCGAAAAGGAILAMVLH